MPFTTTAPGNFILAHNLGIIPTTVIFEFTDGGTVWFQDVRYDSTNLYLVASDSGVTGFAIVYASCGDC
jgi:MinD-like ATPase involved in chromosome partitioning or flagellar assembly